MSFCWSVHCTLYMLEFIRLISISLFSFLYIYESCACQQAFIFIFRLIFSNLSSAVLNESYAHARHRWHKRRWNWANILTDISTNISTHTIVISCSFLNGATNENKHPTDTKWTVCGWHMNTKYCDSLSFVYIYFLNFWFFTFL